MLFLLALFPSIQAGIDVQLPGACGLPMDQGKDCGNATIRYYMDKSRLSCFPFKYLGCGGNENNYPTESDCFRCMPMDLNFCPGNTDPVKDVNGSSYCNFQQKCAPGSQCRMGFAVGLCCSNESIKKESADSSPICPQSKEVVKTQRFGFDSILQGLNCSDDFCPRGTSCHKGEFISYCCK
ncbi:unnamed protein product, partial [Mesorhabditis belari]|uniref:BPTI/Kunitz inhibitor domain-containing protein n=1 Tax=Mesorhabditis belari TaxID=2138241 RepID=A0AAF3J9G0_9BILA